MSVVIVDGVIVQTSITNCKCRWGCVLFFLSSSPSPPSLPPSSLLPVPCLLNISTTLVVPVHSIRLDYGCVVVDTCSVWSVSQCCRAMICCSWWCHRTRSRDWISGDKRWKGWPRFPQKKQKNIGSHFTPYPFLKNHFWNFPALLSAALGSFSGYENPQTVLYVFSLMISCHTLTYKCRKGGLGSVVLIPWLWAYTHLLPAFDSQSFSQGSSLWKTDIFILVSVENISAGLHFTTVQLTAELKVHTQHPPHTIRPWFSK